MTKKAKAELPYLDISNWDIPARWDEAYWNGWLLDRATYELAYPAYPGGGTYPINVERFTSAWAVLDTIMQVSGKTWATDECLAGLVHALNDILHPQANLRGNTRLTVGEIRQRIVNQGSKPTAPV